MQREFIDISKWDFYNKVLEYSRSKRMNYYVDEHEARQIKEAAPLVKFTYKKAVRQAEQEMLTHLLAAADHMTADAVLVSSKAIQLMCAPGKLLNHAEEIYHFVKPFDDRHCIHKNHDTSIRMVEIYKQKTYYGRTKDITLTPIDSEIDGMYLKNGDKWDRTTNRESIIKHISNMGFVSRPGRPPTAVNSAECSMDTMNQINEVVDICRKLGVKSEWSNVLIHTAQKLLRSYITSNIKELRSKVKSIVYPTIK